MQLSQKDYSRFPGTTKENKKSHYDLFSSEDFNPKVAENEEGMQMIRPRRYLKKYKKKEANFFERLGLCNVKRTVLVLTWTVL
jgi:hypothetical protein